MYHSPYHSAGSDKMGLKDEVNCVPGLSVIPLCSIKCRHGMSQQSLYQFDMMRWVEKLTSKSFFLTVRKNNDYKCIDLGKSALEEFVDYAISILQ